MLGYKVRRAPHVWRFLEVRKPSFQLLPVTLLPAVYQEGRLPGHRKLEIQSNNVKTLNFISFVAALLVAGGCVTKFNSCKKKE